MNLLKELKSQNFVGYTAILIYALITIIVGGWYYEPWRDQAHIWVILRDTGWLDIFTTIPANLHPFLWFLLVKPLVVLNFPYQSSILLNILCCCFAVFLFIRKAPLPLWLKTGLIFSYPFIYEFAFPGRIYALGIVLSFAICSLFQSRHARPFLFCSLIALSFHTHTLFLSISLPILFLFIYESWSNKSLFTRAYVLPLTLVMLSGIYMIWYTLSVARFSNLLAIPVKTNNITDYIELGLTATKNQFKPLAILCFLLFLGLQIRNKKKLFITLFSFGFIFYCFEYILPEFIRYYQVLPVVLISLYWIFESGFNLEPKNNTIPPANTPGSKKSSSNSSPKSQNGWSYLPLVFQISFGLCTSVSLFYGLRQVYIEIKQSHSNASQVATYLKANKLLDYPIIGHRSYLASSVVPYLPKNKSIWYPDRKEFGTYLKLDSTYYLNNLKIGYTEAILEAEKQFSNEKKLVLILGVTIPAEFKNRWRKVYHTENIPIQSDEIYDIYIRDN